MKLFNRFTVLNRAVSPWTGFVFLTFILFLTGCSTFEGFGKDMKSLSDNTVEGAKKVDAWMTEHMW